MLFGLSGNAQSLNAGWLPTINYNIDLKRGWKINGKLESRFNFQSPIYGLTDLQVGAAVKTRPNQSFSVAYLIRHEESLLSHRFIQQYTLVNKFRSLSFGQRFRADQTLNSSNQTYRLRYRMTFILPFNGEAVDVQEFYFKGNNEYFVSYRNQLTAEFRIAPAVGFQLTKSEIELGLDYRFSGIGSVTRQQIWLSTAFYFNI